jgi:hypothetical protein
MNEQYEAPAIETTTPVDEPLNTLSNSEPSDRTPAWRTQEAGE